ncbi:hypothetical protein [Pontibaca salina]|uniref:Phasin domain-containing protein n=1 Tax=Pontibaca salina TaxID=2795731 RepID=A0A934M0H6_9RHOB|nr:hypothetical protein [Pontibaca salina]MBI6629743.1 hypothetical protein [Pontibaca salina]
MTKPPAKAAKQKPEVAKRTPPSLKAREDENNRLEIDIDGDFDRISNEVTSKSVALGLIGQIVSLGSWSKRLDEQAANFSIGFLDAMQPKDAAEALLLTQMAATHQAAMMMAQKLNHISTIQQQDAAERAMNKLTRSFTAQMDTLKRYRSKGQQTVRVERVTVEPGAQAVVGNVHHGGRGNNET